MKQCQEKEYSLDGIRFHVECFEGSISPLPVRMFNVLMEYIEDLDLSCIASFEFDVSDLTALNAPCRRVFYSMVSKFNGV